MKRILSLICLGLSVVPLVGAADLNPGGLSDVFSYIYFGGPADPDADADGDGVSNRDEMLWGTNPTNAASKVTGPAVAFTSSGLLFTWPALPWRSYDLLASQDMTSWQSVASGPVSNYLEHMDALNTPTQRFYRLRVTLDQTDADGNGIPDWADALYLQATTHQLDGRWDSDGDGLPDLQEFILGRNPALKDHPAVGLTVFTPLEK